MKDYATRKLLPHEVPMWIRQGARHFITINCKDRNQNILCAGDCPNALMNSIRHYETLHRWYILLIVLMPNHLHGIITFDLNQGIRNIVAAWKGYVAKSNAIKWQHNFFEHRLRSDEEFVEKAHYMRMNPVIRGLCQAPDDWPWVLDRTNVTIR